MKNRLSGLLYGAVLLGLSSPVFAAPQTITDVVARSGGTFDRYYFDYDILVTAVVTAGLDGALADPGADLTLFAPNDLAFVLLARDLGYTGFDEAEAWSFLVAALTSLGGGDPIPILTDVLLYHVAPTRLGVTDIVFGTVIPTLLTGADIRPDFTRLRDNDPDLEDPVAMLPFRFRATNGVIYTINRVLIPIDVP